MIFENWQKLGKLNAKWIITKLDEDESRIEHKMGKLNAKWIEHKLDEDASWIEHKLDYNQIERKIG